eukprot:TRINITY_DN998_c0_g1_i3.p1 TRINITY_DN998_c0_g1~~TRINITY_DN998_c0_g1_i3.p1  ORF type:complete len:759 (-),score=59.55 TRINITY_DN998_c0_g1_i3:507-2783(-)
MKVILTFLSLIVGLTIGQPTVVPDTGINSANCPSCINAWQVTNSPGTKFKSYIIIFGYTHTRWSCPFIDSRVVEGVYMKTPWNDWQQCLFGIVNNDILFGHGTCESVSCVFGTFDYSCSYDASILYDEPFAIFPSDDRVWCSWACRKSCSPAPSSSTYEMYYRCGDNYTVIGSEECDDGNNADGDGCGKYCVWEDPCATNNAGCSPIAQCTSYRGVASCRCPKNYVGPPTACSKSCPSIVKSYVISPAMMTFNDSRAYCQSINLYLANVSSDEETILVRNALLAAGATEGWIGLYTRYRKDNIGVYEWVSQDRFPDNFGTAATYTPWENGTTKTITAGLYAYITNNGTWRVGNNNQYRNAVCEKPCGTKCPNGVLDSGEQCDDNNSNNGDGCSNCMIESGYICEGSPSVCKGINYCDNATAVCISGNNCAYTGPGTFTCECPFGYSGDGKISGVGCNEINRCTQIPYPCVSNASCTKTGPGTFTCSCGLGYSGDGTVLGTGCNPVNYCEDLTSCVNISTRCNYDGPGQFTCFCPTNYTGDGKTNGNQCSPVNVCLTNNPCVGNATCTYSGPGTATCSCNEGYQGIATIPGSCDPINRCNDQTPVCSPNSVCIFTGPNIYECKCAEGYEGNYSVDGCKPINACLKTPSPCDSFASCQNTGPNQFNCICSEGYSGAGLLSNGCNPICGDGKVLSPEGCDDNNTKSGDGCSPTCTIERGYTCVSQINSDFSSFLISNCTKTSRPTCDVGATFLSLTKYYYY